MSVRKRDRRRHRVLAGAAIMGLPLLLSACASNESPTTSAGDATSNDSLTEGTGEAIATENSSPLVIGVNLPLSGGAGNLGNLNLAGIELAVDDVNSRGGIDGRELQLVTVDNESVGATAASLAERLIDQDQVIAIIGSADSGTSLAVAEVINDLEVPQIATQPSSLEFAKPFPWSFRVQTDGSGFYRFNTQRLAEIEGATKQALVVTTQTYGQEAKANLPEVAEEFGVDFVDVWEIEPGTTNLDSVAAEIKGSGAEAIQEYNFDATSSVAFFQARRAQDLTIPTMVSGAVVPSLLEALSPEDLSAEMNYRAGPFWWDPEGNPEAAAFRDLYASQSDEELPDDPSGILFGYTAAQVLIEGLQNAEFTGDVESDRAALRDALEGISEMPIPMGSGDATASFSAEEHDVLHAAEHGVYTKVVDGVPIPVEE